MAEKKVKGVKDLMLKEGYKAMDVQKRLIEDGALGNYLSTSNISNLINGHTKPYDSYTYIILSRLFAVPLETIIMRYSAVEQHGSDTSDIY